MENIRNKLGNILILSIAIFVVIIVTACKKPSDSNNASENVTLVDSGQNLGNGSCFGIALGDIDDLKEFSKMVSEFTNIIQTLNA